MRPSGIRHGVTVSRHSSRCHGVNTVLHGSPRIDDPGDPASGPGHSGFINDPQTKQESMDGGLPNTNTNRPVVGGAPGYEFHALPGPFMECPLISM